MTDGLKDAHRIAIIDLLRANERVERAVLFGSRATETFTHGSDVDIALFGESLTIADQARLAAAMEELAVPQMVDLLLYEGIEDATLRKHVQRHGIELYRRQKNASATRLHLLPKHRRVLEVLLREHLPDVETWAYGSRVNGRSHDGSDLDLVLRGPGLTKISSDQLENFEEAVREASIPFLVEVCDWTQLPECFQRKIEQNHVVLIMGKEGSFPNSVWETVKIEDISEKVAMGPFGSSIKVSTFVSEGIPIISGQHLHGVRVDDSRGYNFITEEHAQRLTNANVQQGDIVITHRGNIGQISYIPKNSKFDRYVVSQSQCYMRCDLSKAMPEFVTNYFRSYEGQHKLLANTSQVGVPSIAKPVTYLRTIELSLPSLPEQRAIADILGALDDKIELNQRMNETLEMMARAIFKDWFVDFGPVRAKMEGREPYLSSEIWDLFPDIFNGDGKPVGWNEKTISNFATIKGGKQLPKDQFVENGTIPVFGGAGIMGYTDKANADGVVIVVGRVGAYCGQFFSYRGKAWVNNNASHIVPAEGVSAEWLFFALRALNMDTIKKGAAQPFVSNTDIAKMLIMDPGEIMLGVFHDCIVDLVLRKNVKEKENIILTKIRNFLLPKLVFGEICLDSAKETVEDVL